MGRGGEGLLVMTWLGRSSTRLYGSHISLPCGFTQTQPPTVPSGLLHQGFPQRRVLAGGHRKIRLAAGAAATWERPSQRQLEFMFSFLVLTFWLSQPCVSKAFFSDSVKA